MKTEVSYWDTVSTYIATFPNGVDEDGNDVEGACDVEVQVGEHNNVWYIRTKDDAGGEDVGPSTGYPSREDAVAVVFAETLDEGNDYPNAEEYLKAQLKAAAGDPNEDGEFCLYWETALEDDEGPRTRYATREQAEAATKLANQQLKDHYPGSALLCCYVTRQLVDGDWI